MYNMTTKYPGVTLKETFLFQVPIISPSPATKTKPALVESEYI